MKIKLTAVITSISLFASQHLLAQDDYDPEDEIEHERLAHLNLSQFEIWSIVVGVILIIIGRSLADKKPSIAAVSYILGGIGLLPLLMVAFAVVGKIIKYGFILAVIVGGGYMLFFAKKKEKTDK